MTEHALAWRPSRRLPVRATWVLWLLCLAATPVAMVLEHLTVRAPDVASPLRISTAIAFLWAVLAWLWPERSRRPQMLALTATAAFATHLATGAVLLPDWRSSLGAAVSTVALMAATLAVYRWRIGDDNLAPHRPRDVTDLAFAALVGALVVVPLGPAPGVWVTSSAFEVAWWVVPSTVYVFIGGACLLLLVQRAPRTEAVPTPLVVLYAQLVVTAACITLVFAYDELPLTWIVLLPAIWAGLSLGPWASAAYNIIVALTVVLVQSVPAGNRPYGPLDRAELLLLDVMMASFVFVVLLQSLLRDQRAHLAEEVVRRRQEALDQAGLLGTVFESINEALVLMDRSGIVQLHNSAAAQILGREKLVSEPPLWLGREPDRPSFVYSFNRDGTEDGLRMLSVQLASVQYAGSDSVVAIVRDVTTEQRRIEELASFAAVAAHDLKGPLAAVQGWIEVAEDSMASDPAQSLTALARGRTAADRMSREIGDWLAYNVAREGVVHPEPVALDACLEPIVAAHPDARFEISTPDTVLVDPTLLRQLLLNLVGNAAKYTRPGEPACVTVRSESDPESPWVQVQVADTGIGIPAGEELTVFEPFRRGSTVRGYQGSGLGLALCKRIVRRHGGRISARRNDPDPGTTVTLTLPRA